MNSPVAVAVGHARSNARRARYVVAVLAVGTMLTTVAGCAPASPAQPQISTAQPTAQPPVSAAPSATPTVSALPPAPLTPEPPHLFGDNGTCKSVMPLASITEIAGEDMTLSPTDFSVGGDIFDARILGGISCYWYPTDTSDGGLNVALAAFPATGPLPSSRDSQKCQSTDVGNNLTSVSCSASFTVDGYWFTWAMGDSGHVSSSDMSAKSKALKTALRAQVTEAGPAAAYSRPAGSWPAKPDCAAIAKATKLLSTLGEPTWKLVDRGPTGMAFTAPSSVSAIFFQSAAGCKWGERQDDWPSFDFQIYPGGAWYASHLETQPDMSFVTIPGTTYALRSEDEFGGSIFIEAFDGVNWLRMWCGSEDEYARDVALIPSILAELDKQAAK
jgi:hypothetical protein